MTPVNPLSVRLRNPLLNFVMQRVTALPALAAVYQAWLDHRAVTGQENPGKVLDLLDFVLDRQMHTQLLLTEQSQQALAAVPRQGPLVFVCNHPLGALEGMMLGRLLLNVRPDIKVLANELLLRIPEFADFFIGVDVLNAGAEARNSRGIRQVHTHLQNGGAMLIFPAGTVSVLQSWGGEIADAPWHPMVARLCLKHHAMCVPMFLHGQNNRRFYQAGLIHKRLRTALLGRAMLAQRGKNFSCSVGKVIDPSDLQAISGADSVTQYLRLCSDQLGRTTDAGDADSITPSISGLQAFQSAVRPDVASAVLQAKIEELAPYRVAEFRDFAVFCAPYEALGCMMEQIAISRERTFREVAEGSGKELDQDRFDPYYWHLWVWDCKAHQLVGGYRIKKIEATSGGAGAAQLYSRSLYHYDELFLQKLGSAVEVGRSFVCSAYQRQPHALDLLWKGIGAFVLNNPGVHTLFGCVSISRAYTPIARQLLAETFLFHYGADRSIRDSVTPSAPLKPLPRAWDKALLEKLIDIPILNKLIGRLSDGRSIPILVRHYLALNGRFISFTVNHDFNQSLDGLILVDLRQAPAKYIDRYLGQEGAQDFRRLHGVADAA
jgi:putative hemolysin